jgi:hypothetical protein
MADCCSLQLETLPLSADLNLGNARSPRMTVMKSQSTAGTGCLALLAFTGWPVLGATLSMPATALYIYRHYPARFHQSDVWMLFAGMAPVAAILVAWWTARKRAKPTYVIALRAIVLLLVSFCGTLWVLEKYKVPFGAVMLLSIFTGWGSIAVLLVLIPLLNRATGAQSAAIAPAPPAPQRPQHWSRPGSSGRNHRPRQQRTRPKQGQNRARHADQARSQDPARSQPASDGKPQYRAKQQDEHKAPGRHRSAAEGAPRTRRPAEPHAPRSRKPAQGDGEPRYRQDSARQSPRPDADGKPKYRDGT